LNLCAALAAIEALGLDAIGAGAGGGLASRPLPHRPADARDRATASSSSTTPISTTPHASLAALDCHRGRRIAIIVGGYDRGVDWGVFAERMAVEPPVAVITMGQNGPRITRRSSRSASTTASRSRKRRKWRTRSAWAASLLENNGMILPVAGRAELPALQGLRRARPPLRQGRRLRPQGQQPHPGPRRRLKNRVGLRIQPGRQAEAGGANIGLRPSPTGVPPCARSRLRPARHFPVFRQPLRQRRAARREDFLEDGGKDFDGYLVWDDCLEGAAPGLVMVPNWWGVTDAAVAKGQGPGRQGLRDPAGDVYGRGLRPKNPDEAGKASGAASADPKACARMRPPRWRR
jgi:hypothetical protein